MKNPIRRDDAALAMVLAKANTDPSPCADGAAVHYGEYRAHFQPRTGRPVHWTWQSVAHALASTSQAERGSLTLSSDATPEGCELLPGMAINVQVVPAGGRTRPHAHAWWHLFIVRSGTARAVLGTDDTRRIAAGDLLLVPAWNEHRFHNDGSEDLVLLSMSNLPDQAALANHLALEPEDTAA